MQSGRRIASFANQGGDVGVGQGGDVGVGQGGDVGVGQGDVGVEQGDVSTGQRDNTNTRQGVDTTIRHKVGRVVQSTMKLDSYHSNHHTYPYSLE